MIDDWLLRILLWIGPGAMGGGPGGNYLFPVGVFDSEKAVVLGFPPRCGGGPGGPPGPFNPGGGSGFGGPRFL